MSQFFKQTSNRSKPTYSSKNKRFERKRRNEKFLRKNRRQEIYSLVSCYLVSHEWNQAEAISSQVTQTDIGEALLCRDTIRPSFFLPLPTAPRHIFSTLARINSDATANETGRGQIKPRLTTHLWIPFPRHLLLPFCFQLVVSRSFVSSLLVRLFIASIHCDFLFARDVVA